MNAYKTVLQSTASSFTWMTAWPPGLAPIIIGIFFQFVVIYKLIASQIHVLPAFYVFRIHDQSVATLYEFIVSISIFTNSRAVKMQEFTYCHASQNHVRSALTNPRVQALRIQLISNFTNPGVQALRIHLSSIIHTNQSLGFV